MVAVIGTRDLIPPQGRVSVELYNPDTGRVRKKVRAENAILDWLAEQIAPNQGRGPGASFLGTPFQSGLGPLQGIIQLGNLPYDQYQLTTGRVDLIEQPGAWPFQCPPMALNQWLWATDSSAAVDTTARHIPGTDGVGEVTAGVYLRSQFAADGVQNKRGYLDIAACERSYTRTRIVAELLPGIGDGTYRSIGLGSLLHLETGTGGLRACPGSVGGGAAWLETGGPGVVGGADQGYANFTDFGSVGNDPDKNVAYASTSVISSVAYLFDHTTTGVPTSFTHGYGSVLLGYAPLTGAGNFWIGQGQNLHRGNRTGVVPYHSTVETVDISASLGAEEILNVTHNGVDTIWVLTDTRVFTFDAGGTKTITGSWLHNLTFTSRQPNFGWDGTYLWITIGNNGQVAAPQWGVSVGTGSAVPIDDLVSRAFTTAGADTGLRFVTPNVVVNAGGTSSMDASGPATFIGDGDFFWKSMALSTSEYGMIFHNSTMGTHALLPSDIVKGPTDALRITYDFTF